MASLSASSSSSWLIERPIIMRPYVGAVVTVWPPNSNNLVLDHEPTNRVDRIILLNQLTQEITMMRETDIGFDDVLNDIMINQGQVPASQVMIDGLPMVEIKGTDEIESLGDECVICLEEWKVGDVAKVMPCKHKFHDGCVERWLKIHGSCPVCRCNMHVHGLDGKKVLDESGRRRIRRRRERWVILGFGDEEIWNED